MQMFTPLSASGGSTFSEFYLAQIDAVHAGKTMEIKLWDPGDTNPLSANLQIEIPTSGGWSADQLRLGRRGGHRGIRDGELQRDERAAASRRS